MRIFAASPPDNYVHKRFSDHYSSNESIGIKFRLAWLQLWSLGPTKLQRVDICSLMNYTPIIFSSDLIWIDWSTWKMANFCFSNSFSMSKISLVCLIFFSSQNIKLGEIFLLPTLFNYFHFWSTLFSEIKPNFRRAPINPNQFRWKNNWQMIYQWAYAYSL